MRGNDGNKELSVFLFCAPAHTGRSVLRVLRQAWPASPALHSARTVPAMHCARSELACESKQYAIQSAVCNHHYPQHYLDPPRSLTTPTVTSTTSTIISHDVGSDCDTDNYYTLPARL